MLGVGVSDTTPGTESTPRAGGAVPASTKPPPCAEAMAAARGVAPVTTSGVVACVRAAAMEAASARELAVMTALNCKEGGGASVAKAQTTHPLVAPARTVDDPIPRLPPASAADVTGTPAAPDDGGAYVESTTLVTSADELRRRARRTAAERASSAGLRAPLPVFAPDAAAAAIVRPASPRRASSTRRLWRSSRRAAGRAGEDAGSVWRRLMLGSEMLTSTTAAAVTDEWLPPFPLQLPLAHCETA